MSLKKPGRSAVAAVAWAAVAIGLPACGALPGEPYRYSDGWRSGFVVAVGPSEAIAPLLVPHDCRLAPESFVHTGNRYALVIHGTRQGLLVQRVVPVASEATIKPLDWVRVNIERCDAPLVPAAPP